MFFSFFSTDFFSPRFKYCKEIHSLFHNISGVSGTSNLQRIRDAHRRIIIVNHPDKGGSPYLASKINEAKDILEGKAKGN